MSVHLSLFLATSEYHDFFFKGAVLTCFFLLLKRIICDEHSAEHASCNRKRAQNAKKFPANSVASSIANPPHLYFVFTAKPKY